MWFVFFQKTFHSKCFFCFCCFVRLSYWPLQWQWIFFDITALVYPNILISFGWTNLTRRHSKKLWRDKSTLNYEIIQLRISQGKIQRIGMHTKPFQYETIYILDVQIIKSITERCVWKILLISAILQILWKFTDSVNSCRMLLQVLILDIGLINSDIVKKNIWTLVQNVWGKQFRVRDT